MSMPDDPELISVIMPAYNSAGTIEAAAASVLEQTYENIELLIADDASSDDTPEICQTLASRDRRVRVISNPSNLGALKTRLKAIREAKGEWIAFLDSDDFVEPPLYEKMCALMDQGYDVCVTDIEYWYQDPARRFIMKGLSDWPAETIQKKAMA